MLSPFAIIMIAFSVAFGLELAFGTLSKLFKRVERVFRNRAVAAAERHYQLAIERRNANNTVAAQEYYEQAKYRLEWARLFRDVC